MRKDARQVIDPSVFSFIGFPCWRSKNSVPSSLEMKRDLVLHSVLAIQLIFDEVIERAKYGILSLTQKEYRHIPIGSVLYNGERHLDPLLGTSALCCNFLRRVFRVNTKLENQYICAVINSHGAELASLLLKKDNTEYMWSGNPQIWGRHAPVLFPIVGRVIENRYTINDQQFELSQHGFARDREFQVVEVNADSVMYRLTYSGDTLVKFPYRFQLDIGYCLKDSGIVVKYLVKNIDNCNMYFSIGAHPGFNCPVLPLEKFEDYYLEFQEEETADRYCLKDGLIDKKIEFFQNQSRISLSHELFAEGALIFKNLRSEKIVLKSQKSEKSIAVSYKGFPYLGIWSVEGGAPFVCIEPWCGLTDTYGESKEFSQKEGINCLAPGQEFKREYSISIT